MKKPKVISLAKPYQTEANNGLGWYGYRACSENCYVPGCNTGIKKGRVFCFKHFSLLDRKHKRYISSPARTTEQVKEAIRFILDKRATRRER